ncbi:MAG: hypothetical protein K0Q59_559 [Paenibacillus sp.]|jgi:hypothetical protein|nr:hypothetical protein [Paenibacillus sp.]
MDKRLSRSYYLFSLMFIFMLVCVSGAFFFGLQLGTDRAETKYATMMAKREEAAQLPGAYDQQYLVSFYHTIYVPYRGFTDIWFDKLKQLEVQSGSADAAAIMKELGKSADDTYSSLSKATTPENSPLLNEAHQNVLKGIKLFAEAARSFQSKANAVHPSVLLTELNKDAYLQEAKKFALQGQQQFYMAIVKWSEATDPQVKGANLLSQTAFSLKDWGEMSLNVKNAAIASILQNEKLYMPVYPQDLTVGVDELLASGQSKKMNLNDIQSIVAMLADTNAARKGDFLARKDKWYKNETIPLLPFFF